MSEKKELLNSTLMDLLEVEAELFEIEDLRKNQVASIVKKFLTIIKTNSETTDDSE